MATWQEVKAAVLQFGKNCENNDDDTMSCELIGQQVIVMRVTDPKVGEWVVCLCPISNFSVNQVDAVLKKLLEKHYGGLTKLNDLYIVRQSLPLEIPVEVIMKTMAFVAYVAKEIAI